MRRFAVGLSAALCLAFPLAGAVRATTDHPAEPARTAAAGAPSQGEKRTVVGTVRLLGMAPTPHAAPDDHDGHGMPAEHHRLVLDTGTESLFLTGRTVRPNVRARVTGTVTDRTMHAETITEIAAAPEPVPPRGTMKVLVMLAHWNVPDHVTQESAREQMFTDSAAWFRDASYGKVDLTGDVTPWMQIEGPRDGRCFADHLNLMERAQQAAAILGYDAGDYDNTVLYFPNNGWQPGSDCNGLAGWAYVGAQGAWINGYLDRRVTVHELGHNYGLQHSHSYLCSNVLSGTCGFQEYGDTFDAMGGSNYVGHFSASQKRLLGWLDGRLSDLSEGGSTTIAPMASDAAGTTAVRVAVSGNRTYWMEYRQPVDFDSPLPASATDGVLVHVTDPTIALDGGPNLIDVRPSDGVSTFSATLRPGSSWRSPEGYRFSVGTVTAAGATVTVDAGDGPSCRDLALEPDTAASARTVAVPTTQRRSFCTTSDQDWVTFEAVAGQTYRLETANAASGVDTRLDLFGPDGTTLVASDDDTGSRTSRIRFGPETSGTYLLRAEQVTGAGDDDYTYDLRVALDGGNDGPEVTARTPAPDATGVSRGTSVTVTFSEDVTGVSTRTFLLKKAGGSSTIKAKVSRSDDRWVLDPSSELSSDTRWTVTLTGGSAGIRDEDGNPLPTTSWTFLTGTAPTIKSRTPDADDTRINRVAPVVVAFSEKVTGVGEATFTLRDATTGTPVSAKVTQEDDAEWELDPRADLIADTRYTVTLTGGPDAIRDRAGNPLTTTGWTFMTGPTPTVAARTPASGAKNVSRGSGVAVTFSEEVTGVDATTLRLKDSKSKVVTATVVRDGATRWVLDPADPLKANTRYTVTLTGGPAAIRDVAGNPLSSTSWSFTTQR